MLIETRLKILSDFKGCIKCFALAHVKTCGNPIQAEKK